MGVILNNENIFLKIISYSPLFFIPFMVGFVSYILINSYNTSFENNLKELEKDLYAIEKQAIKTKILNVSNIITVRKSGIKKELISRVQERVNMAYNIAQSIYNANKGILSDNQIKNQIKNALKSLEWNNAESSISITDYDGTIHLPANNLKHLEGSSIINFQGTTGRYIIKEEIEICKKDEEGFLWDTFSQQNEDTKKQYKQVVFVKSFGYYNWYFSSSEYLNTATRYTNKKFLETLRYIDNISNKNYVFVINTEGSSLMNNLLPKDTNKNTFDIDTNLRTSVKKLMLESIKNKDSNYISYKWLNPSSGTMETKYSFIKRVPTSDWIIGSGFYLSDINSKLSKQKVDMYDVMYKKSSKILLIALFAIIISLLISYYITKKLKESFFNYKQSIDAQKLQLEELNATLEQKVEKRTQELVNIKNNFEQLATTDALTSLNNRYSLMKLFATEISRSRRYEQALSILILDIDFFKKVNDTYGHSMGDIVLISLSMLIKKSLRNVDIAGRYGGEEFLILLPNTALNNAKIFAQRLRKEVQVYSFEIVNHITVSIGLVELLENETLDEVFKRADALLYKSKSDGRNRVSL